MWITPALEHTRLHMFCWGGINNGVVAQKNKALVLNAWWDIIVKLQTLWQCSDHSHMICEYHLHVPYTYITRNICSSLVQVSADDIVLLHCAETWKRFMSTMCLQAGCIFHTIDGLSLSLHGNTHVHTCTHTHTHTHTTDGYVARLRAALNSTGLPQDQPLRTQSANVHKAARQTICIH